MYMKKLRLFTLLLAGIIGISVNSYAQIGGKRAFDFLNIPGTAKVAGIGGVNITAADRDVNMFLYNPALLNKEVAGYMSINYIPYLADINYTTLAYAYEFKKTGTWALGLQYINYGEFEGYDATGMATGNFKANAFAITVGKSHVIGNFTLGANFKFAASDISSFAATALLLDLGGNFEHPDKDFNVGLTFKNLGVLLKDFTAESESHLPFDIQLGTTFKPEFMPFRFSITAYNLNKSDVGFFDPAGRLGSNKEEPGTVDKIFRHLAFGTELLLSENVNLRAGYNHLIRKELRLEQISGGAGFSLGFIVRVKAFELAYSHSFYHVAGGANHFTLASNLGTIFKKKDI